MNIFILDYNITKNAQFHCDKHVIKMILEYAQMICTTCNLNGVETPYKSTHLNHPCSIWTRQSSENLLYLYDLAKALNLEYRSRYGKDVDHKSIGILNSIKFPKLKNSGLTEFAQAMPEEYKRPSAVQAYRAYYIGEKQKIAKWKNGIPYWFTNNDKDAI